MDSIIRQAHGLMEEHTHGVDSKPLGIFPLSITQQLKNHSLFCLTTSQKLCSLAVCGDHILAKKSWLLNFSALPRPPPPHPTCLTRDLTLLHKPFPSTTSLQDSVSSREHYHLLSLPLHHRKGKFGLWVWLVIIASNTYLTHEPTSGSLIWRILWKSTMLTRQPFFTSVLINGAN